MRNQGLRRTNQCLRTTNQGLRKTSHLGARAVVLLLALIWGCSDGGDGTGVTGSSGTGSSASIIQPSAVLSVSGDGQIGTVGTPVSQPLVVKVTNAAGSGVKGLTVTWSVTEGGGALSTSSTTTTASGTATQPAWTLGTTAGKQQVAAAVTGLKAVTFNAKGEPASPTSISVSPAQFSLRVRESETLTATATDSYGNAITEGITWSSSDTDVATVEGSGVVRALYPGTVTITATVGGASAGSSLTVMAPPVADIIPVSGQSWQGIAGETLDTPLLVEAKDPTGSPAPGVEVRWTVTQGGGTLSPATDLPSPSSSGQSATSSPDLTNPTDSNGLTGVIWTLGPGTGTQTVSASVEGTAPVVFVAAAAPGEAATVDVTPAEATVGVGQTFSLSGTVRDAAGNPVFTPLVWTSSDATVAFVDSNTGVVTGMSVGTASITGTAGDAEGSALVTVTPQTPSAVVAISGDGQTGTVGSTLGNPLVAEVRDAGGNPLQGVAVEWAVTRGNGAINATSNRTDSAGRIQAAFTLSTTAGTNEATVQVPGLAPLAFTATGQAGATTSIEVLPAFLTVGIGQSENLTSIPRDSYGNTVTVPVTWTSLAPDIVSVDGTAQVTGVSAGLAVIEASLGEVVGSAEVSVPSIAPGFLSTISGTGQTGTVGSSLPDPLVVQVRSAGGEPMEGIAVQWAVTQGGGTVSATSTRTNASGKAQVHWVMGTTVGFGQVTASVSHLSPLAFSATAMAGPATSVRVSPDPATVTAGKTIGFTSSVTDAYGNAVSAPVSWSSSNESVAMIGVSTGLAAGMTAGSAIITALTGNVSGSAALTVEPVPAPVAVSDLSVVSTTESSATLNFHQVNDGTDHAASYEIRFFTGAGDWASATPVFSGSCAGVIEGTGIGNPVTCTIDGLASGTSYQFLARSRRVDPGNVVVYGGVSNAASTTIPSTDPAIPVSLVILSGDGQTGPAGSTLPQALTVEVRNGMGGGIPGVDVDWAVTQGGGSVDVSGGSTSDANGQVQASWTLGTGTGTNKLSVSVAGSLINEFTATATAGPVASITVSPTTKSVDVGTSTAFTALGRDEYGNLVYPTYTWSSQNTGIATPVSPPGTFFGVSAGNTVVTASADGVSGQASINVLATASPTIRIVSGNGQTGPYGYPLNPLVVEVRDAQGNPSVGFPVAWAVTQGDGGVSSNATSTDTNGQTQVGWTLGYSPGIHAVTASVVGVGSVTFTATGYLDSGGGGSHVEGGPNEPAGYFGVVGREFNSKASARGDDGEGDFPWKTGGSEGWNEQEAARPLWEITEDESAPLSPPNVIRAKYPAQTVPDGTTFSPGPIATYTFNTRFHDYVEITEIYAQFAFKLGPNYQTNPAGNKLVFFRTRGNPRGEPLIGLRAVDGGGFTVGWKLQGTEEGDRKVLPVGDNVVYPNQWYILEVQLVLNSAIGVGDGILRTWIRTPGGTSSLIFELTDVKIRNPVTGADTPWGTVHVDPTFGGQGGTISEDFYLYLDHWWVSGR